MRPADPVFLGIDTSCYTTSLALVDSRSRLIAERRLLLPVAAGETGLRQSEGVFHHTSRLPGLVEELCLSLDFSPRERLCHRHRHVRRDGIGARREKPRYHTSVRYLCCGASRKGARYGNASRRGVHRFIARKKSYRHKKNRNKLKGQTHEAQ